MILYSTNCPKCRVLEMKMKQKGIDFEVTNDISKLIELGFKFAPALETEDGEILDFSAAVKYINNIEKEDKSE